MDLSGSFFSLAGKLHDFNVLQNIDPTSPNYTGGASRVKTAGFSRSIRQNR